MATDLISLNGVTHAKTRAANSLYAKVPADLSQLLSSVICVEQVHAATHVPPGSQLAVTSQEQAALKNTRNKCTKQTPAGIKLNTRLLVIDWTSL